MPERRWRIVVVEPGTEDDLTDSELLGLSILAAQYGGEPADDYNVYFRAWRKLQPMAVETLLEKPDE